MSKQNDGLYKGPAALDAFDLATFPDSKEAQLGGNAFLAPDDLAYFEETLRLHRPAAGGLLVDLGCGRGALGRYLAERLGMDLAGVDTSAAALEQAKATATTVHARWLNCDFAKLELPNESAAAIISLDGIYVAVDPRAMLREVARISMRGAPLIFTACVPRFREAALDWQSGLREHHFTVLERKEVSEEWRAWLRAKHERRLKCAVELGQRLEEREVAAALEASKTILGGDPPWLSTQRRYRITARYEPELDAIKG